MRNKVWILFITLWATSDCQNSLWKNGSQCLYNDTCYKESLVKKEVIDTSNTGKLATPPQICLTKTGQDGACVDPKMCKSDGTLQVYAESVLVARTSIDDCNAPNICCSIPSNKQTVSTKFDTEKVTDEKSADKTKPSESTVEVAIKACTTADKKQGACVKSFMCNNTVINIYGQHAIVPRIGDDECDRLELETCCSFPDMIAPRDNVTESEINTPVIHSCGKRLVEFKPIVRISNDEDVDTAEGEFPWVVGVFKEEIDKKTKYLGGGSLIHTKVVLTAAHILKVNESDSLFIRAGDWSIKKTWMQDRKVVKIIQHPEYDYNGLLNDIALLILDKDVAVNDYVELICLPQISEDAAPGTCVAAGWGMRSSNDSIDSFHKVDLPIVKRSECEAKLKTTIAGAFFKLHESFVCAGGKPGKDTCIGDGGSPLMCPHPNDPNLYVQSGIVSWGLECAGTTPSIYTNVGHFKQWIDLQLMNL